MCSVSFVMSHYADRWTSRAAPAADPTRPYAPVAPAPLAPDEVSELRKLLERAREYDLRTGQPDCESEDKKARLLELARALGVEDAVRAALGAALGPAAPAPKGPPSPKDLADAVSRLRANRRQRAAEQVARSRPRL